jgi:hypothetical protein
MILSLKVRYYIGFALLEKRVVTLESNKVSHELIIPLLKSDINAKIENIQKQIDDSLKLFMESIYFLIEYISDREYIWKALCAFQNKASTLEEAAKSIYLTSARNCIRRS